MVRTKARCIQPQDLWFLGVCQGARSETCKLDHNDYTGIFLGYRATNQNIRYLNTTTGIVKKATMKRLMKHGISNPHGLLLTSSSMT